MSRTWPIYPSLQEKTIGIIAIALLLTGLVIVGAITVTIWVVRLAI